MKDPYSILGVSRDASDADIKAAYRRLAKKYHPDNYSDDNPLKELAIEKMQEVNAAYDEIQRIRKEAEGAGAKSSSSSGAYSGTNAFYIEVRKKIQASRFSEAMRMLNSVNEFDRVAEWHYLMAVCLMQKGRPNDAMRELELACSLDPANEEYQKAKEMFNKRAAGYGSTYYDDGGRAGYRRSASDEACNCCANLICLDCLCECMGGDFIGCI